MAYDPYASVASILAQFDIRLTAAEAGGTPTPTPAPTLNALSLSPNTATAGTAYTGTVTGSKTAGSALALTGAGSPGLNLSGLSVTGTPTTAGAVNIVETLAGATNSPNASNGVLTVSAAVAASISSVNSTGWTGEWASGTPPTFAPDTSPMTASVTRSGYTATAGSGDTTSATTYNEARTFTARLRQPAPNDSTLTATTVVLDDYVYSTDVIAGVTNNSTTSSPKPVAQHAYAPRRNIDSAVNQLPVAVITDHRDGVAAVVFSVTDGTTTLTRTVVAPVVANRTGDQFSVEEYQHTFDVSTLAVGRLTHSAKVYPRIGGSTAVFNSSDQTIETRTFCDQYVARGPRYFVYVDAAGNDTTGTVSTTAATAEAAPCLTIAGAIARARVLMPGNLVGGLEIRLNAGTWTNGGVAFNTYQNANSAEVVITRNPNVPRASVIFTYATAPVWRLSYIRMQDITITRTAAVFMAVGAQLTLRDVDFDLGGFSTNIDSNAVYMEGGVSFTNVGATSLLTTGKTFMGRGIVAGSFGGTTISVDNYSLVGCKLPNAEAKTVSASESNIVISGSVVGTNASGGSGGINVASIAAATASGILLRNVVIEFYGGSATPGTGMRVSADGTGSNTEHVIIRGVTMVGQEAAGRANIGYDESSGTTRRTHNLWRSEGNNFSQINNKSDRFVQTQGNADAPNRIGAWPVMYGVGFRANIGRYPDAGSPTVGSASFRQDYPGLAAKIATDSASPINTGFTNYQGTTWTIGGGYVAGAGGGTYSVSAGSTAKGMLTNSRNKFDIAGTTRASPDTAGAYA